MVHVWINTGSVSEEDGGLLGRLCFAVVLKFDESGTANKVKQK